LVARSALAILLLVTVFGGRSSPVMVRAAALSPLTTTQAFAPPPILASAAALLDADTGQWLYLKNADQPLPMASTTKMMTALLAIRAGHLDDLVRVSHAAATIGESTMGLHAGERVSMRDLLYGLLLPSGNDAAIAIAEHVAGSQAAFLALMNVTAQAMGLTETHFTSPYGFADTPDGDDPAHHASARDLVVLARAVMALPLFARIVATKHYVVRATTHNRKHVLDSVDTVVFWYPGADGIKPGWTTGAGICQVVDARRYGHHVIAVLLHTPNLFTDARDLLNYGFGDFTWKPSIFRADQKSRTILTGSGSHRSLYFPFTGHDIHGPFLHYYQLHGGINVLGMPRTPVIQEAGVAEQYFTNQVLTLNRTTGQVSPLPLGVQAVPDPSWLARVKPVDNTSWRTYFAPSGHTVTYRFRACYLRNGGPATFGYPISEKSWLGKSLVQYFEAAEFIWLPKSTADCPIAMAPLGQERLYHIGLLPPLAPLLPRPVTGETPLGMAPGSGIPAIDHAVPVPTTVP
jgi:D-alanyl-D-alanine carboxypeptidase